MLRNTQQWFSNQWNIGEQFKSYEPSKIYIVQLGIQLNGNQLVSINFPAPNLTFSGERTLGPGKVFLIAIDRDILAWKVIRHFRVHQTFTVACTMRDTHSYWSRIKYVTRRHVTFPKCGEIFASRPIVHTYSVVFHASSRISEKSNVISVIVKTIRRTYVCVSSLAVQCDKELIS